MRSRANLQLLLAGLVSIWCGNFIALKMCLSVMSPLGVTAFRVIVAAILLSASYAFSSKRYPLADIQWTDVIFFLKLSLSGLLLNHIFFIGGLKFTTVSHSALMVTFGPLFTLIFAWRRGQERLSTRTACGMLISICGIACLNVDKDLRLRSEYLFGDFLTLCGSVAFAYYTVLSKKVASVYGSLSSTAFTYVTGALLLLPIGLPSLWSVHWNDLSWTTIAAFFYVSVLASVLAPLIFYYALRHISASRIASLTYLQPVVTTISSVLILSERLSFMFLLGAGLILFGTFITHKSSVIT